MNNNLNVNILMMTFCLMLAIGAWLPMKAEGGAAAKIEVSHSFRVGASWLPAGRYTIRVVSTSTDMPLLSIESEEGRSTLLVPARHCDVLGAQTSNLSGATFSPRQDQMRLTQVWFGGRSSGYEVIGGA